MEAEEKGALLAEYAARIEPFSSAPESKIISVSKNPLCGDLVARITEKPFFYGTGCILSRAATGIASSIAAVQGITQLKALLPTYKKLLEGKNVTKEEVESLGEFIIFSDLHQFPLRVECVLLPFKGL